MRKTTGELLETLKSSSLKAYLRDNKDELSDNPIAEYLSLAMEEKGLKKSDVIKSSGIQTNYAYQIFSGLKLPSRDKLICLCFGMALSFDEAQALLKYSGFAPLYPRNKRDSVIIFALQNKKSVIDCNLLLDEYNLSPI